MKRLLPTLLVVLCVFQLNAQNYFEKFKEYSNNRDTIRQRELLEKWENDQPKDAELYTSLFNYYFAKSRNEVVLLASGKPPKGEKKVLLVKDSLNKVAGFIDSRIDFEQSNLKKAFESIETGIELYPNRLDMRFGKIYVLGQIKDWRNFTDEIIKTVNYSVINKNQWTWTLNESRGDADVFFLGALQDYQMQLYNTMDDALLKNMQEIANAVLNHYPKHIESLSNLSIAFLVEKNFEKALQPLLKAEKLNPHDFIVLNNIAYAYREMKNNKKALEYYQKVLKYGDQQAKTTAEQEINRLK